jgi:hypothetical protein
MLNTIAPLILSLRLGDLVILSLRLGVLVILSLRLGVLGVYPTGSRWRVYGGSFKNRVVGMSEYSGGNSRRWKLLDARGSLHCSLTCCNINLLDLTLPRLEIGGFY